MRMAMSAPRWIGVPGINAVLGQASGTMWACKIFSAKVNAIVFSFCVCGQNKGPCVSAEPEFFHCIVVVICRTRNRDDNFSDIVAFLGGIYKNE